MADQKNDLTKNAGTTPGQTSGMSGATSGSGMTSASGQTGSTPDSGQSVTGAATAAARSFYDQAKETAGQAYDAVTDKAAVKLDEKKTTLSDGLSTVADSIRQAGENMNRDTSTENAIADAISRYSGTAAHKIQDVAAYFDRKDVRGMARDLEGYARRNPAIFIGAAFGIGMLAARFLKSSKPDSRYRSSERQFATPRGSFEADRGGVGMHEEESGQGLQMADQSFEPRSGKTGTTADNLGSSSTTGTAKKKTGSSTKGTGSTRDSLSNPM